MCGEIGFENKKKELAGVGLAFGFCGIIKA